MSTLVLILIFAAVGLAIALIFEDSRDWLVEQLEYIISFEWLGDFWDFVSGAFEDISEISFWGLLFAGIGFLVVFIPRKRMLGSFTQYMEPTGALIITVLTYAIVIIVGYFIGRGFENS